MTFILLGFISFSASANTLSSLKSDIGVNDRQMLRFIEMSYTSFSSDSEVQLCAQKLRSREKFSIEATYSVLVYKLYNEISKQGTRLKKLKANKKLIKITPYYINSLNYCNN